MGSLGCYKHIVDDAYCPAVEQNNSSIMLYMLDNFSKCF